MKVLAGLITQGTGSLGGMTMSKNRAGYYLRSRTVPTNPKTSKQVIVRSNFSSYSAAWQGLTSAQQAAWNLYAKNVPVILNNGTHKLLSGLNWFVAVNQTRVQASLSYITAAPTTYSMAGPLIPTTAVYKSSSTLELIGSVLVPPTAANTGDRILIQLGRPRSLGRQYFSGPWQYATWIDTYSLGLGPVPFVIGSATGYAAVSNQNQWLRFVRVLPDGRYSTPVIFGPQAGWTAGTGYGIVNDPWTATMAHAGGITTNPNTSGTLTSVVDLGTTPTNLSFTVSSGVLTVTNVSGTVSTYNTTLELNGSLGIVFLPTTITLT